MMSQIDLIHSFPKSYRLFSHQEKLETEAYSGPTQTSKMKFFAKMVISSQPLNILAKSSILDVYYEF